VARACVGLGANLGDREGNLRAALAVLQAPGDVRVVAVSSFHDTEPMGGPPQPNYLNAAAVVETGLSPQDLLKRLLAIETALGRVRGERWGPRQIDLDLLLYEDRVILTQTLQVPHPRMHERRFVLAPLAEVAPDARHPVLGRAVAEMLAALQGPDSANP
jgi:2-amino-4-hydroxy-6-hydroxymethyldihydropteridine diphosphokinase